VSGQGPWQSHIPCPEAPKAKTGNAAIDKIIDATGGSTRQPGGAGSVVRYSPKPGTAATTARAPVATQLPVPRPYSLPVIKTAEQEHQLKLVPKSLPTTRLASSVSSLMAALCRRKRARENSERQRSMVVESSA
jgi:hypothetical protein